jgi:hypothetical protein
MRFYTKQHKAYCGIDLHVRTMYLCILHQDGEILLHRNLQTSPDMFLKAIAPYREDLVVAVACIFTWYWLADLCAQEQIPFVLGHALSMKAIHGGKAKNDKIDVERVGACRPGIPEPSAVDWTLAPTPDIGRSIPPDNVAAPPPNLSLTGAYRCAALPWSRTV